MFNPLRNAAEVRRNVDRLREVYQTIYDCNIAEKIQEAENNGDYEVDVLVPVEKYAAVEAILINHGYTVSHVRNSQVNMKISWKWTGKNEDDTRIQKEDGYTYEEEDG